MKRSKLGEVPGKEKLKAAAVLLVAFCFALVLFFFKPGSGGIYPPCPFHALTGLYCPGCGTLRGLHQLLHGHFWAALDYNPLMVLSLPFIGYYLASQVSILTRGRPLKAYFYPVWLIWTIFYVIIGYWVIRNLPWFPFTYLAP